MPDTRTAYQALLEHLGPLRDEMGDLIADAALGANILNPDTKKLLQDLFASMPESDNLTLDDIARNIREVGLPSAEEVATDIEYAASELD